MDVIGGVGLFRIGGDQALDRSALDRHEAGGGIDTGGKGPAPFELGAFANFPT